MTLSVCFGKQRRRQGSDGAAGPQDESQHCDRANITEATFALFLLVLDKLLVQHR